MTCSFFIGAGFTSNLPSGPDYGGVQGLNQELDSSSSIAASTLNTAAQSLNITPELLAQVSSFLNLPPLSSTAGTSPSSGPSLIPQGNRGTPQLGTKLFVHCGKALHSNDWSLTSVLYLEVIPLFRGHPLFRGYPFI